MKALNDAVARIALEVHPDRIRAVCSALSVAEDANIIAAVKRALGSAFSPKLITSLADALAAAPGISAADLSNMFLASSATASLASGASSVELVCSGPATGIVPIRHTAQVLTGMIDETRERLFLVSFVAYHVSTVITALERALERGVRLDVLLEASTDSGGNVTVDSTLMLKDKLPRARFYHWNKAANDSARNASVHAKCAVADRVVAFITSANLSEAALERNIEIGILVRGGSVPLQLDRHLEALIATKQLKAV